MKPEEVKPNATEEETAPEEPIVQPNDCPETFDEPVLKELKLNRQWTLWEHYEMEGKGNDWES